MIDAQTEAGYAAVADAVMAERHLSEFIEQAWHVVEPATPYVSGWHIEAMCEYLEAVSRGEILRLLINIPPRHMKSLTVSVFWPCWEWATNPSIRWLFSSYAQTLSVRDSVKCRRLILSPWYQRRWGDKFQLTGDQNEKLRFENDRSGYRLATSVDGSNTGEGGDRLVSDDPHNVKEGESETQRQNTLDWWDGVMSTRGNDPKTAARVIVMQRVHEDDLSGHVLASERGYTHLCLPAEYEPSHPFIWPHDPRTREGELLWSERFNAKALAELKADLGSYRSAGQLQQRPAPREGGNFKRSWFEIVDAAPAQAARVRAWDNAGTEGAGDFTAGLLMAKTAGMIYIEDVVRGQWSSGERDKIKKQTAELDRQKYGNSVRIHNEQEGGSAGKDVAAHEAWMLIGYPVTSERPTGEKEIRAQPLASQAEAGNVKLVRGAWNEAFLDEVTIFPNGKHDDQVDAGSAAFRKLLLYGEAALAEQPRDFAIVTTRRTGKPGLLGELSRKFWDAEAQRGS